MSSVEEVRGVVNALIAKVNAAYATHQRSREMLNTSISQLSGAHEQATEALRNHRVVLSELQEAIQLGRATIGQSASAYAQSAIVWLQQIHDSVEGDLLQLSKLDDSILEDRATATNVQSNVDEDTGKLTQVSESLGNYSTTL